MNLQNSFTLLCVHTLVDVTHGFVSITTAKKEIALSRSEYKHNASGHGFEVTCPEKCVCRANEVDCSNRNLEDIPEDIPAETLGLNLSFNDVKTIRNNSLSQLVHLQYLNFSHNDIERLEERCFHGLVQLKCLSLAFNKIQTAAAIPDVVFSPLSSLEELHLHGNCDSATTRDCQYHDTAISEASKLMALSLDGLETSPLGPGFGKLQQLQRITYGYGYCWLPHINTETFRVFGTTYLEHLELNHCHILTIESNSFAMLTSLSSLLITDHSKLCEQGLQNATIGLNETQIRRLDLIKNCNADSMKFEDDLFLDLSRTKLEVLNMEGCNIEIISIKTVTHLPLSLKVLIIRNNRLRHPQFLLGLPLLENLEYIDCSIQSRYTNTRDQNVADINDAMIAYNVVGNKREFADATEMDGSSLIEHRENELHVNRARMPNGSPGSIPWPNPVPLPPRLKLLNVSFLKLPEYPLFRVNFSTKNVLETIDVSHDMFKESNGKIRGLHHLKVFNASGNRLHYIHPETFGDMKSLVHLSLHNNDIGRYQLDQDTFVNQTNLNHLDISVNTITGLPHDIFRSLTNLTHLLLNNNSLSSVKFGLKHLHNLKVLDLSYNQITTIPETARSELDHAFAQDPNFMIYIDGNNLLCDCEHQTFIGWLSSASNHIARLNKLQCTYSNGTVLSLARLQQIVDALAVNCATWKVILGCTVTFVGLLLVLSLLAVLHHQHWKIKYLYYIGRRNVNPYQPLYTASPDLHTDAYISFNEESPSFYAFVTRVFYTELQRRGLTVKIREEIVAGRNLHEEITEAINHSKKVIVFLTPGFGDDFWNIFEFNVAALQGIYSQKMKLIIVMVGGLAISDVHPGIKKYVQHDDVIRYNEQTFFVDFISEIERKML